MLQEKDTVKFIEFPQLRGNGHVERIQNHRMLKQTAKAAMELTKKKERTRMRWRDKVEENLNPMGIKNWQTMARDHWE
jgi:hypothetical protein